MREKSKIEKGVINHSKKKKKKIESAKLWAGV